MRAPCPIPTRQFILAPDLAPPALTAQLQQTHPPRPPARVPDDNWPPRLFAAERQARPEPVCRHHLHFLEPPHHPDQEEGQDQEDAGDDASGGPRSQTPLDGTTGPGRGGADQEGKGLRDREPGRHAGVARVRGSLLHHDLGDAVSWPADHAGL